MVRTEVEVERLVRENEKLVQFVVNRCMRRYAVPGMEREDLVSWGMLGLVQAARAWDPDRAGSFTTLACTVIERMIARGVRGVFFLPHGMAGEGRELNRRVSELFTRANVPLVLLDRDIVDFPQRSAHDLVGVDNIRGGYLLGQHLVDVGCKRTLFFSENVAFSSARGRWTGYRAAMEANGL